MSGSTMSKTKRFFTGLRFGLNARISFYERMAAFLEAGIAVFDAVEAIRGRMEKNKDIRTAMFAEWLEVLRSGGRFCDALRPWISTSEFMLISAGENGGRLIDGLHQAVRLSAAASRIKKAIFAGAALPALLLAMISVMIAGFDLYMVPVFKNLLPVSQWPDSAQTLYNISHFITSYWYVLIGVAGVVSFGISSTINIWVGRAREIADHLPPWSIYKSYQASSFLIGLASMMSAGVALNDALRMINRNAPPWLQVHVNQMLAALKSGKNSNYGEALDTGLFDSETAGDISDYSRLSSFEKAIDKIGQQMIDEGVERTNQRMAVAKNIMLFLVAGTVFWIYGTTYGLQTVIAEKAQQGR